MSAPIVPALAVDHVAIASADGSSSLGALIGDAAPAGLLMASGVRVGRFGPGAMLELVWPQTLGSPVDGFLARRGPGLHHVAFRVEERVTDLAERLRAAGVELAGGIEPSSDGRPSLFIHPRSTGGVLVELVEGAA